MRHLKHRSELGRTKEHRAALMANLSAALLTHGRIETTLPKAKALRPFVERIITLAKKAEAAGPGSQAVHYRRQAVAKVRNKAAVAKLFRERASEFTSRPGGYTRIYKLGQRTGDAAEMALITLIAGSDEGYDRKRTGKPAQQEAQPAAAAAEAPAQEAPAQEAPAAEASAPEQTEQKQ